MNNDIWYRAQVLEGDNTWRTVAETQDFDYAVWCLAYEKYDKNIKQVVLTPQSKLKIGI